MTDAAEWSSRLTTGGGSSNAYGRKKFFEEAGDDSGVDGDVDIDDATGDVSDNDGNGGTESNGPFDQLSCVSVCRDADGCNILIPVYVFRRFNVYIEAEQNCTRRFFALEISVIFSVFVTSVLVNGNFRSDFSKPSL